LGGGPPEAGGMKTSKSTDAIAARRDMWERWTKACIFLDDLGKPAWKRTADAMQAFGGLKLTPLSPRDRECLETMLLQINDVTAGYPIETWEDYQKIAAADLSQIGQLIRTLF